ncbi:hypothetical protein CO610_03670 [Lysobacteraceae bacterium NML95-0200]|nr:hypothetical protein CO610_03670 [Xanthomonadaceae bacterium NML95-0200]
MEIYKLIDVSRIEGGLKNYLAEKWGALKEQLSGVDSESGTLDIFKEEIERASVCARAPKNDGTWSAEKGGDVWVPKPDKVPYNSNPDGKTWGEILEENGIEGIGFKDGYPDFSPISKGDVEINDFTKSRPRNFAQADRKLAEQWAEEGKDGKTDWTAKDVREWRKENNHTWHEHQDCKTMQLVPREVHNNVSHDGGICEVKKSLGNGSES